VIRDSVLGKLPIIRWPHLKTVLTRDAERNQLLECYKIVTLAFVES